MSKKLRNFQKDKKSENVCLVDISTLNLLIKFFNDTKKLNNISDEELNDLMCGIDFRLVNNLSKHQIRSFWIYLIRHNDLYCEICGNPIKEDSHNKLTFEHRIPKSKGGKNHFSNLGPAHIICNKLKDDYMPDDWERVGGKILTKHKIIINEQYSRYNYLER